MNHFNRSLSWILVFGIVGLHFHEKGYGPVYWVFLALQFLVYPHVVYLRARRSTEQLSAEIQNMLLDAACFGVWGAVLGFPLWIIHTLVVAGCLNMAAFRGARGALQALLAVAVGALLVYAVGGAGPLAFGTSLTVSALCMAALLIYLVMFARSTHTRTILLNDTRVKLRQSEQALQKQLEAVQSLQQQLTEQANRDPLTGLYNRRYLNDSLQRELDRCARDLAPLSVLLIDLDHFKAVNDSYGHATGDQVLRCVGAALQQFLRASDICCRYGGEEFLLVLPGMGLDAALARAEQYRQLLASHVWADCPLPPGCRVTLSIGVACTPNGQAEQDHLIQQADRALYQAKAAGRDRVCAIDA